MITSNTAARPALLSGAAMSSTRTIEGLGRDFVCAGCRRTFPLTTPGKYVKREGIAYGLGRERLFHSVDCLIRCEQPSAKAAS